MLTIQICLKTLGVHGYKAMPMTQSQRQSNGFQRIGRAMMKTQVHRRIIGIGKTEPKNQIHRQVVGVEKTGQMLDHGNKGVGIMTQRSQVQRQTNGQSGAGTTALKDQAHHRAIGPRKVGITTFGSRIHQRIISKIENKDGKLRMLEENGTVMDIGKDIEVSILV